MGQGNIVIENYNVCILCYSLTNPVVINGMLMVGCGRGLFVENVITMTTLSRRVDKVQVVLWYWAGSVNVITMTTLSRRVDKVQVVLWC